MSFKRVRSLPLFPSPKDSDPPPPPPDMDVDASFLSASSRTNHLKRRSGSRTSPQTSALPTRDPPSNSPHSLTPSHKRSGGSFDESSSQSRHSSRHAWGRGRPASRSGRFSSSSRTRPCTFFLRGHCAKGKKCGFLHSFTSTQALSFVTALHGHEKAIRAIALPTGSNKMYTAGQDGTIRIWDCDTGQCTTVVQMGSDVGCMMTRSGWLFVGLANEVKALNLQTNSEQRLVGPKGQVHTLLVFNDMLFAGAQDGNILAWKFNSVLDSFQPAATLSGHAGAVLSLEIMEGRLYSASMDSTIKVWDLMTGFCVQTLQAHSNVVMGLLCWNQCLLSGSLDGTVKVWGLNQTGAFDLLYTHPNDEGVHEHLDGVLAVSGFVDHQNKDMLLCSLNDNSVRLLELPSFTERAILFSKDEIRALQIGPDGLVISGDGDGSIKIWRWAP